MKITTRRATLAAAASLLAVFAGLAGCGNEPGGWGVHSSDLDRSGTERDVRLFVRFGAYGHDSWPVAFWSSERWTSFEASWDRKSAAVVYRGSLQLDGAEVAVECSTPDGRSGSVRIGPDRFRLEDGPLFLIRAANGNGGGVKVVQLKRSPADLPRDPEILAGLLDSDAAIAGFFRQEDPES